MLEGSLRNVPLTDVFQVVATSQKSGTLTLVRGRSRARVLFDHGRVRYAYMAPGVNLGELLVRMDLLTVSEMLELLGRQTRENPGLPLGLAAVAAGYLDEAELSSALERQVFEVLVELLSWRSGNFSFGEGDDRAQQVPITHGFEAMMLLMQVSQLLADYEEGAVPPTAVFRQAGDPTKVSMPPSGWEVLAAVDGRRPAASVAAELDIPERQVYSLLHTLQGLGVVEPSPFPMDVPPVLVVTPSYAHGRLLRLLLLRNRALPHVEAEPKQALEYLGQHQPKAVVIDDHDSFAWQFLREVRRLPGKAHLPAVVLTTAGSDAGVLAKMRRPRALTLVKPYKELDFQGLLQRMIG
jgi:hypothetical protein